jgi:hypothetical protein
MDADIQQLLMEDLRYQVECLVCTPGSMIYILCIFINYEQVNGKNRNLAKESQAALMTNQGELRTELQLRKRKSSITLSNIIAQRPRIQSSLLGSAGYDNFDVVDNLLTVPDSGSDYGNGNNET